MQINFGNAHLSSLKPSQRPKGVVTLQDDKTGDVFQAADYTAKREGTIKFYPNYYDVICPEDNLPITDAEGNVREYPYDPKTNYITGVSVVED